MRFVMREKFFAFGDDFEVEDDSGRRAFYVDGKVLTIRTTLVMTDAAGEKVALIRKRLLALGTTYEIEDPDGRTLATVHKKMFTLFRAKFAVNVPGPDDLHAAGDFTGHDYVFVRGGGEVAWVNKRWLSISHAYGIEVADPRDAALIVASAVVIELCIHDQHDRD